MKNRSVNRKIASTFYITIAISLLIHVFQRIPECTSANAPGFTIVCVEPNYIQVPENGTGEQFTINVSIYRATNVYGYEFKLFYNSTLLNGTAVSEGSFLRNGGNTQFTVKDFDDQYNITHGLVWIYSFLLGSKPGVNGTGTLVTITFKTKPFTGLSYLQLEDTKLSDPSPNLILHHVIGGAIYIGTPPQIRVPADYSTIQQAIDAATTGTIILVSNGTYPENLVIDKTVSIIGENKSATIIDANSLGTALLVTANSVSITGFTIENASSYAILFNNSSFTEIYDNIIENSGYGLYFNNSIRNNVTNNLITGNSEDGIQLFGTATIANNTIKSNGGYALNVNFSFANIAGNELESNNGGICLNYSGGSILRENSLDNNTQNFSVDGETLSDYLQDIDDSNTVNGKTMSYLTNQRNVTINPDTFPNIGYLGIVNSTDIHVANLNFTNNGEGILLAFTQNSTIENVGVENNFVGIKCAGCGNLNITKVRFKNNFRGIQMLYFCWNDEITKCNLVNTIPPVAEIGLELTNCNNATLVGNSIIGYSYAFYLYQSSTNIIYHNNIINNSEQVYAENSSNNKWDNGHQGNYWSSYNGTDQNGDGIGDTSCQLGCNQTDNYPLIHPYVPDIAVTNITVNSTKTYIGQTLTVTVTVVNKWYENETFNVAVYANSTLIGTLTATDLAPYTRINLTTYWNTSGLMPSNYTLHAQADILPGETETSDNAYTGRTIRAIVFNVDFNNDGVVNVLDLRKAAIYFGYVGDCQYDLNFDNIVNLDDLRIIVENFGKTT